MPLPQYNLDGTVPSTGVNPSAQYQTMQQNYLSTLNALAVDHIGFNTSGTGYHNFVRMPAQGSVPTLTSGYGAVYCKTANSETQQYYSPDTGGFQYQMTRTIAGSTGTFGAATGWTFLPGGLIMQYNKVTTGASSGTVTFPVTFSTGVYSIQTTGFYSGSAPNGVATIAVKPTNSGFSWAFITNSGAYAGFYWVAIGN